MIKKKSFVFVIAITIIVSMALGLLVGRTAFNNSDKSIDNTTINSELESDIEEDIDNTPVNSDAEENVDNSNADDDIHYPFKPYKRFLVCGSDHIEEKLNDNPIDKFYYKKYINYKSAQDEQEILEDWSEAYEKEFENAVKVFKEVANKRSSTAEAPNIEFEEVLKIAETYIDCCPTYTESTALLAYDIEEFCLGSGTGHVYSLICNSLEINRLNTLRLIECIDMLSSKDYPWLELPKQ